MIISYMLCYNVGWLCLGGGFLAFVYFQLQCYGGGASVTKLVS